MHFWIDKRSVCGQRRAPLLWAPRPYVPKYYPAPMTTPVHRFQRIESMQLDSRRRADGGRGRNGRMRRLGSASRVPTDDDEEAARTRLTDSIPNSGSGEEVCVTRLSVPPGGRSSRRTSANSSVYSRTPDNFNLFRMGGINWCLWVSFIIITLLLVPAHLYLKNFDYRGELIGIFFVIILLFLVCFSVSLFHTKTRAILLHRLNLEDDARGCNLESEMPPPRRRPLFPTTTSLAHNRLSRHMVYPPVRTSVSTPDLLVNGRATSTLGGDSVTRSHSQATRGTLYGNPGSSEVREGRSEISPASDLSGGDPPPYHVAILLPAPTHSPTRGRTCETPPPAYEVLQ